MNSFTFSINSLIGEGGQGSIFNQFFIEFQKRKLIEKVYCSAKGKYSLEGLPLEAVSLGAKAASVFCHIPYLRKRKDIITLASDIIFDKIVSNSINLKNSGIFIGAAGHCLHTIKKLKYKTNKKVVLCCMNSHIQNLYSTLESEDREFSKGKKTHFVHEVMVKRMLEEYELSDYIFVLSKYAFDSFVRHGVLKSKLRMVNPGVDLSRFYPGRDKGNGVFRVCFVGSLTLRKGFHYLLRALDELNIPDLELLIYGSSSDRVCNKIVKYYKRRIKIEQRMGDSADGYRRSSVFLFPTLEDGWGLVVSEAMACGLPVVTTENCGAKDIIEEGVNGFIMPAKSVEAIKDKIMVLYNDRKLLYKMSEEALKKRGMLNQEISAPLFFDECMKLAEEY